MKHAVLMAGIALSVAAGAASAGKLYKWVDENGVTQYSTTMPAEHKDRKSVELDSKGRVRKEITAAPTQAELKAVEDAKTQKVVDQKKAYEQARKDNALMNTYTSESEIDAARDRALAGVKQVIESYDPRIKSAKARHAQLKQHADLMAQKGKPVSDVQKSDIAAAEREIAQLESEVKAKQAEMVRLQERYEADKTRYRELTHVAKQ